VRRYGQDVFGPFGSIEFVEFQKGEESGYVRFTDAVAAAAVAKLSEGEGTDIGGAKPKLRVLEGLSARASARERVPSAGLTRRGAALVRG